MCACLRGTQWAQQSLQNGTCCTGHHLWFGVWMAKEIFCLLGFVFMFVKAAGFNGWIPFVGDGNDWVLLASPRARSCRGDPTTGARAQSEIMETGSYGSLEWFWVCCQSPAKRLGRVRISKASGWFLRVFFCFMGCIKCDYAPIAQPLNCVCKRWLVRQEFS